MLISKITPLRTLNFVASVAFVTACYFLLLPIIAGSSTPLYATAVWSLCYLAALVYMLMSFSAVLYVIPNLQGFVQSSLRGRNSFFISVDGLMILKLLLTPTILLLIVHSTWSGPALTAWFGHLTFSAFQYKVTPLLLLMMASYVIVLSASMHYSSINAYDFTATVFHFFTWIWLIFFSNNLFTFIFFLELLSTLVMLLLATSTFSSAHAYNNLSYSNASYMQNSTPTAFLQSLLVFFWTTLVASLTLFLFTILFYLQFLTFDWNITSALFAFLISSSSLKSLFVLSFSWFLMLVCIFIKSGIVPFYFWKPAFFRGITFITLFFYVYVYYFSIFFYFVYVIFFNLNELFVFNLYLLLFFIILGTLMISSLLFESFYLKVFIALSSILNSLLIMYALSSVQLVDLMFVF